MVRLEQRMSPFGTVLTQARVSLEGGYCRVSTVLTRVTWARMSLQGGYSRVSTVTQKKVPLGAALTGAMST